MRKELLQSGTGDLLKCEATSLQCRAGITRWAVRTCDIRRNGDPDFLKGSFAIWGRGCIIWWNALQRTQTLCEKCPYSEFYWSVFVRIQTEYVDIGVFLLIQSECGKIRTRKTPNTDTFHAVNLLFLLGLIWYTMNSSW